MPISAPKFTKAAPFRAAFIVLETKGIVSKELF